MIKKMLDDLRIFSVFRGECVALAQNMPDYPGAPGQYDGLPQIIEKIPACNVKKRLPSTAWCR